MIKIDKTSNLNKQRFEDGENRYVIKNLIDLAKSLKVQEMPLEHLNIYKLFPEIRNTRDWIKEIHLVLNANLKCPIILDDEGYVMDGRHRVAKALLREKETIKFVRFEKTPDADYLMGDKK